MHPFSSISGEPFVVVPANSGDPYSAAPARFARVADSFCSKKRLWLWVPAFAGTTNVGDTTQRSRRGLPRKIYLMTSCHPKHQRAQGMPGARRARSLACKIKKHTSIVTTVTPDSPGIPYAMVLTVSFALSSVIGLVLSPSACGKVSARLDASVEASGPHDFAVRESAVRQQHPHRPPHLVPRS